MEHPLALREDFLSTFIDMSSKIWYLVRGPLCHRSFVEEFAMTGSHVIKVVVGKRKRVYSVVAIRELGEHDTVCSECGKSAPSVQLIVDRIFNQKGEVSRLGLSLLQPILSEEMQKHVYASPVCGHPNCWSTFSVKLTEQIIKDLESLRRVA